MEAFVRFRKAGGFRVICLKASKLRININTVKEIINLIFYELNSIK